MSKYYFMFLLIFTFTSAIIGQEDPIIPEDLNNDEQVTTSTTTATIDSTTIVSNTFFEIFTGKPGRAAFYGLILPGGGQIYNRRWWKLPLVYGVEGLLVNSIIKNTKAYKGYQDAYIAGLNGNGYPHEGTSDVAILRTNRDAFRKAREYAWVFFIGGHIVTIFEAFIDRHLMEFDISEDLTFTPIITDVGVFNGFTYTIPLNKKKKIYEFKNLLE